MWLEEKNIWARNFHLSNRIKQSQAPYKTPKLLFIIDKGKKVRTRERCFIIMKIWEASETLSKERTIYLTHAPI